MISITARFLADARLARASARCFPFVLICDFVSKLGKMPTEETETSVE